MVEKDFQRIFNLWARANKKLLPTGAYELKLCKGKSIAFDVVAEHQEVALLEVCGEGNYYKINDAPWIRNQKFSFTKPKPYDAYILRGEAYVVVMWWKPREKKIAYCIDIKDWIKEREKGERKSLTEERAKELSMLTIDKWEK